MNNKLSVTVNFLTVDCDYETGERVGAGGTFQVSRIIADTEYGEFDITSLIDQGNHYNNLQEVADDLGLSDVDIDEG